MSVPDSNDPENNTQEPGEKRKFLQRFRRQKPADSPSEIAAQEVTVNEQQLDAGLENNQVKENKPKETLRVRFRRASFQKQGVALVICLSVIEKLMMSFWKN